MLRLGPAGQLGSDNTRARVDVEHLPVNPEAQEHIAVWVGQPELVAIHASRHERLRRACCERVTRVRVTSEGVVNPRRGEYLMARERRAASGQHAAEPGQVAERGA